MTSDDNGRGTTGEPSRKTIIGPSPFRRTAPAERQYEAVGNEPIPGFADGWPRAEVANDLDHSGIFHAISMPSSVNIINQKLSEGRFGEAYEALKTTLSICETMGEKADVMAEAALKFQDAGAYAYAELLLKKAIAIYSQHDRNKAGSLLQTLAHVDLMGGKCEEATCHFMQALLIMDMMDTQDAARNFEALAIEKIKKGEYEKAAWYYSRAAEYAKDRGASAGLWESAVVTLGRAGGGDDALSEAKRSLFYAYAAKNCGEIVNARQYAGKAVDRLKAYSQAKLENGERRTAVIEMYMAAKVMPSIDEGTSTRINNIAGGMLESISRRDLDAYNRLIKEIKEMKWRVNAVTYFEEFLTGTSDYSGQIMIGNRPVAQVAEVPAGHEEVTDSDLAAAMEALGREDIPSSKHPTYRDLSVVRETKEEEEKGAREAKEGKRGRRVLISGISAAVLSALVAVGLLVWPGQLGNWNPWTHAGKDAGAQAKKDSSNEKRDVVLDARVAVAPDVLKAADAGATDAMVDAGQPDAKKQPETAQAKPDIYPPKPETTAARAGDAVPEARPADAEKPVQAVEKQAEKAPEPVKAEEKREELAVRSPEGKQGTIENMLKRLNFPDAEAEELAGDEVRARYKIAVILRRSEVLDGKKFSQEHLTVKKQKVNFIPFEELAGAFNALDEKVFSRSEPELIQTVNNENLGRGMRKAAMLELMMREKYGERYWENEKCPDTFEPWKVKKPLLINGENKQTFRTKKERKTWVAAQTVHTTGRRIQRMRNSC